MPSPVHEEYPKTRTNRTIRQLNQSRPIFTHLMHYSHVALILGLPALGGTLFWWATAPESHRNSPSFAPLGIAYSPFGKYDGTSSSPLGIADIEQDMKRISQITNLIRIYSSGDFLGSLAISAQKHNLDVIAGAWIGTSPKQNKAQISSLIEQSHNHSNIRKLLIGNEVLLRSELRSSQLIEHITLAKNETTLPLSTAEPWHIWLDNPELVKAVDFIAVHILPYWEGISVEKSLTYIDMRLGELRALYPDKPLLLAEVGWPSDGPKRNHAIPSPENQAKFAENFAKYARANEIDHIWLEAYDQPWKMAQEGPVGSHWGVFTADRKSKWGFVVKSSYWLLWTFFSVGAGSIILAIYIRTWKTLRSVKLICIGTCFQIIFAGMLLPFILAPEYYLGPLGKPIWLLLSFAQIPLWLLFMLDLIELSNVSWKKQIRLIDVNHVFVAPQELPRISIHLPFSNEPPEIVLECLTSLSQLDYPNFEVIVISNNCTDRERWLPIEKTCIALGPNFSFSHTDHCPGFKAGALNMARKLTSPLTEIIAIIDSDYIVEKNWLRTLAPFFEQENVGIVQAPQDHHSTLSNGFQSGCFWEYAGFFQIGMVQRNEANAIIQHGTMTLVRLQALDEVGGWSEWCLTEDTELGLRILEQGWDAMYTRKSLGKGLLPPDLCAYRNQRFRWVYGGMQILRHHFRYLTGLRKSSLTWSQRYHFLAGWLPWITDFLALIFSVAALFWTAAMSVYPEILPPPSPLFLVPVLGFLLLRQIRNNLLYRIRVNCSERARWRATIAGLSLSCTIARAVFFGLFTLKKVPFIQTPRIARETPIGAKLKDIRAELCLLLLSLALIVIFCLRTGIDDKLEALWTLILVGQVAPYFCTLFMALGTVNHVNTKNDTMMGKTIPATNPDESL